MYQAEVHKNNMPFNNPHTSGGEAYTNIKPIGVARPTSKGKQANYLETTRTASTTSTINFTGKINRCI